MLPDQPTHTELLERLAVAEQTLAAIHAGEVDALVVAGEHGPRIYTLEGADAFYRVLIEQMPVGAAAVQRDGTVLYANSTFAEMLGVSLPTLIGAELADFASADHGATLRGLLSAGHGAGTADIQLARDGEAFDVELSVRPVATADEALCVVAVDLTQRHAAEHAVRFAEERFRGAFDGAPIGMALLDADGIAERVNPALCRILSETEPELLGRPPAWLPADVVLSELIGGDALELRIHHSSGAPSWIAVHLSALTDEHGAVQHYIAQVQDVSERRMHEEQLRHVADHDGLTGLLNRRGFELAMSEHLAMVHRYDVGGAVLLLDVDHFKYVNDERGHQVGDLVLIALAESLAERLRANDVIARLGGDEFAVLLPRGDLGDAETVADNLVRATRSVRIPELAGMRELTVSVGVVAIGSGQRSGGELMGLADLAMYDAKDAGRDRSASYDEDAGAGGSGTEQRMTWLRRIQSALADGTLTLDGQPIVDLASGEVVQHELLVRIPGEDGSPVPAGAWFPVAERYDLASAIDEWVFDRALEILRHDDSGAGLNVNVSARSLGRPPTLERLRDGLRAGDVDASRLTIEITETAAIGNIAAASRFVDDLHGLGCRLALDDFGAGFGSFYYLKHLPFDDVKIDGEFIRNSVNDERDRSIIRAMVDVAGSMGRRTVAECIEDAETLALVSEHGVDLAQGYFLGRPEPMAAPQMPK